MNYVNMHVAATASQAKILYIYCVSENHIILILQVHFTCDVTLSC